MFIKEVTQRNYAISISMERFVEIAEAESFKNIGTCGPTIGEQLDEVDGVWNVEYDGHFGVAIYLTLDVEHDTDEIWAQIEAIIIP